MEVTGALGESRSLFGISAKLFYPAVCYDDTR